MGDHLTPDQRSVAMSRVANRNTGPELTVRRRLHAAGLRFRLHQKDLPGRPDIVLPGLRTVVFVHGCFWHGHDCKRGKRPSSNVEFWNEKIERNMARDRAAVAALRHQGWAVRVIWTCDVDEPVKALISQLNELRRTRGLNG